jgi:hypothetical protein
MSQAISTMGPPADSSITAAEELWLAVEVTVGDDKETLDSKLNDAENRLIPIAFRHRCGLLLTQRGAGKYRVEVDPEVPCGITHELKLKL